MELYRILLAVAVLVVFIPTLFLMNQVNALRSGSDSAALHKKETQLKWCIRALIAVFVIVLAITMGRHYLRISAMHDILNGSAAAQLEFF